ncbi:MAG: ribonuclease P protein component [Candidatus Paceibacterota bacterium]
MLEKKQRLTKEEFDLVYKNGKNVKSTVGYFKMLKNNDDKRVSCTTSRRDTKYSAHRNRIRRRGYGTIEKYFSDIPDGFWIIWFLPAEATDADSSLLDSSVKKMINRLDSV